MSSFRHIAGNPVTAGLWSVVLGGALWFAPTTLAARVHALTWDGLRPGLSLAHWCEDRIQAVWTAHRDAELQALRGQVDELQAALVQEQGRSRRLTAQILTLHDRSAAGFSASNSADDAERLFHPAVIEAAVLGESLSRAWRQGTVLDGGWKQGLRESALVLQSPRPLVDRGARDQLSSEDLLLLGQAVLGKIETVGRWSSTFLPITDPDYRGRAQLARAGDTGPQWGATGLLRGDGTACRLDGIAASESVRVGDVVLTTERDAALGTALTYGTVTEAHLGLDDREWRIVVQPADRPPVVSSVQVLRAALNPARLWAY